MIKIQMKTVIEWIVAIFVIELLFLTQTPLGTADYGKLNHVYIGLGFCMMLSLVFIKKFGIRFKLKSKEIYAYSIIFAPYLLLGLISFIEANLDPDFSVHYVFRYIKVQYIVLIAVILTFALLREKMVDVLFLSCVLNYSVYIIYFTRIYGVIGLFRFIQINEEIEATHQGKILEVHEVTFIFGLLFLFYLMNHKVKGNKVKCIVSLLYLMLGYKRILLAALIVSLCMWVLSRLRRNTKMLSALSYSTFGIVLGWLIFVLSPLYTQLTGQLGIELNGRGFDEKGIYSRLTGYYRFSPFYLGHGYGFVDYRMMLYKQEHIGATNGFHNDILKLYIDIGFIPAILFFFNLIVLNVRRCVNVFTIEKAFQFCCIICMTMVCWMTDNVQTYPNYVFALFSIFLCILFYDTNMTEIHANSEADCIHFNY